VGSIFHASIKWVLIFGKQASNPLNVPEKQTATLTIKYYIHGL
jgi:hypothetical protein